jgi:hypothetical protein
MNQQLNQVPYQVTHLIDCLKDKNERVHVRGNYRDRLNTIKNACDKAITDYDIEMGTVQPPRFKKGQR